MNRIILHLDLDAFFCAVEEQRDPTLKGKAFAVGGQPDQRGVVASCSYAARRYGVRSAMPMSIAVQRCPNLLIIGQHFDLYHQASNRVMALLHDTTPFVEQLSIDEAFLDVTGLHQTGEALARVLQARIRNELGLPCSLGVSTNKLVAKIANNLGKERAQGDGPPNALMIVPPGEEASFLAPLRIEELWGVGPKTADQLHSLGIRTIGMLAQWPADDLERRLGKMGRELAERSRGLDNRPVETEQAAKSISKETTFVRDIQNRTELQRTLQQLAEGVGRQLRQSHLRCTTIKLKLRWSDFTTITRQVTLDTITNADEEIFKAALTLFNAAWIENRPVRLLGVGAAGFEKATQQLSLWDPPQKARNQRLQDTLDELREKYGDEAVQRGSYLHKDD